MEKAKLPREVAEAIEHCKSAGIELVDIPPLLNVIGQLFRDYQPEVIKSLEVLQEYVTSPEDNRMNFLKAIVNGYEVEETPEEKLKRYYLELKLENEQYAPHSNELINSSFELYGIVKTLGILGIKIEGVNT